MSENAFNDILKRIPSLGREIFLLLEFRDLSNCIKVCKTWNEFIDRILLTEPEIRHRFRLERLTHLWTTDESHYQMVREFDCELEMRIDDFHQIKDYWICGDRLFSSVVLRDKHRSEEFRDNFIFAHDLLSERETGLEGCADDTITLKHPLKNLIYAPKLKLLVLHLSHSKAYEDEFEFYDSVHFERIERRILPRTAKNVAVFFCDRKSPSLYLLAWEKPADNYLMLYEMSEGDESFNEHSLIELPEEIHIGSSSFDCFSTQSYFIVNCKNSGHVICYNLIEAEESWKMHFPHHNVLCERGLLSENFAVIILTPKSQEENAVIRIIGAKSGETTYDFEVPDDFEKHSVRYDLCEKYFAASFTDWGLKRIVFEIFQFEKKKSFRTESSSLFAKSFAAVNSLQILENRVLILTLAESDLRKSSLGTLTAVDIEKFLRDENEEEEKFDPFKSIKSMFSVTIFPNKKALKVITNTEFICQLRRSQKSDRHLNRIILQ